MKASEQAKNLADEALERLVSSVKAGKSDSLTAYLAAMGRFHNYSFGNVMLIVTQKPEASRVAGFNTWKSLGRFVKKGEKGILIIAPMVFKPSQDAPAINGDADRTILRFKGVYVFDVSQTDGEPLPEFARVGGNPNGHTDRVKALITEKGIALEYADDIGSAFGVSTIGTIKIRTGLSPAEEFSVLVHELAHEMLHSREYRREASNTVKETEAEAVAFVVGQSIGLETGTAAADYIQLYDGDADTLAESLDRIQKTAAEIIEHIMKQPQAE